MIRRGWPRFTWGVLIAAAILCATSMSASAQMAAPAPLDTPLPTKWQAPVERFLTELRVTDVQEVLKVTKADSAGAFSHEAIMLRLEHARLCEQDRCITIIGEIKAGEFHSHAMFLAGKMVTRADAIGNHPGIATLAKISFLRSKDIPLSGDVTLVETTKGWIVAPSAKPLDDTNNPQK